MVAAAVVLALPAAAQTPAGWSRVDVSADTPGAPAGWQCGPSAPSPDGQARVAVCRETAKDRPGGLALLLLDTRAPMPPLRISRLGDASTATLHAFTPNPPCHGPAATCLAGLLLVDQRDEGGCYGTEVYAWTGDRRPKSLGFIDEFRRGADGTAECLGATLELRAAARGAVLRAAAPLLRLDRQGTARPVAGTAVEYEAVAGAPRLQRRVRP